MTFNTYIFHRPLDPAFYASSANSNAKIKTTFSPGRQMLTFLFAAALACIPQKGKCEVPVAADSVVDSVGINIHLHYTNTVYGNFPLVQSLLKGLGIRHTRDSLVDTTWQPYYQEHIALAKLGIKGLYIASPQESATLLTSWPSRVPGSFEGYEAPNEYDNSGDQNWVATLNGFLPMMYNAVRSNPATQAFPIGGPSFVYGGSAAKVANLAPFFDIANLHNYYGGRNPGTPGWGGNGYGSIQANLAVQQSAWHKKVSVTTETGYTTDPTVGQSVPENVEAKYIPRAIFEQLLHGIPRTYFYELIDEGRQIAGDSGAYGFARQDGSAKPAYTATSNLLTLLTDRGSAPSLQNLQFSLTGATSNVHHLLMQKSDGSYYLAFWLEVQDYDVNTKQATPATAQKITFVSNRVFGTTTLTAFQQDGTIVTTSVLPSASIPLTATDCVTILKLK